MPSRVTAQTQSSQQVLIGAFTPPLLQPQGVFYNALPCSPFPYFESFACALPHWSPCSLITIRKDGMLRPECSMQDVAGDATFLCERTEKLRLLPYLMNGSTAERNGVPRRTWAIAVSHPHLVSTVIPRDAEMPLCCRQNSFYRTIDSTDGRITTSGRLHCETSRELGCINCLNGHPGPPLNFKRGPTAKGWSSI